MYTKTALKRFVVMFVLCALNLCMCSCGKKYENSSLEDKDYATSITIDWDKSKNSDESEEKYVFTFEVVDLTDYSGDAERSLKKEKYIYKAGTLADAVMQYYIENERKLDLGHLKELRLNDEPITEVYEDIVYELSNMPSVAKSLQIECASDEKIILRDLIKLVYSGENSY